MNSFEQPENLRPEERPAWPDAAPHLRKTDAMVGLVLLGEYAILDLLGQGGMAKVYKAKQLSVDRFVAIKTLTTNEPNIVERFSNEVKVHGRLHHKNIVQALDCLIDPATQQSYFVMEFLAGLSIEEMLKRQGPIALERDFVTIANQVCDALEHAHSKGVIHRDLKPGNVILQTLDGELIVKVVDFGIAKVQEEMQRITKTGMVVGSPLYMSPEQCMGKELDVRADVYSLGILFYELLTGDPPYSNGSLMDVMRAHCDPERFPEPIAQAGATVRGDNQLDSILRSALMTEPDRRIQSIQDFKEAINFWYRSVQSDQTDRAVPIPNNKPRQGGRYEAAVDELRDLVAQKQIAQDPQRRFDETLFCTSIAKGTGEKMRITSAQVRFSDSLIGSVLFNRYKILDLLGEGGMSVVYRALDNTTQQVVAIKTLKFHDKDLGARFAREVAIHDELKHPNIVKAIECLESPNGQSFFVMEYLKGVVLQDYIVSQGSVSQFNDICTILGQVLNAIEFAHDQGIMHRDIKPDNIILIEQRGQLRAKVLDFGLAKIQEDLQRLTKTGVVVGSPAYMSPEQCMGKPLDFPSDIYSLAVVAYEMITGKLPFDAETDVEMMKAHCERSSLPAPLTVHRKDIPAVNVLAEIFEKALDKDASNRYQSVDELKAAFDEWWRQANTNPDLISPFKATARRKKRTTAPPKSEAEKKEAVKESAALNDLIDGHRKAQEKTLRAQFEATGPAFDFKSVVKPLIAVICVVIAVGGIWGLSTFIGKMVEQKAAQQASQPQTDTTKQPEASADTTPSTESATETESEKDGNAKLNPFLTKLLTKPATSEIPVDNSSPSNADEFQRDSKPTSRGGGVIRGLNFQQRQ